MASITLHMQINGTNMPVLAIPVNDCNRFSSKPLSWLRFLGYCIYGCEGNISFTPDGPPINYQMAVQAGAQYYFTSPVPPRFLDIQCIDDRISNADTTESRAGFRDQLRARDGTCIVTNASPLLCDASHYFPHSKGSEYLTRLLAHRGSNHHMDNINDIRNGLFLTTPLHRLFGRGHVAFLMTPNFALVQNDVPPSPGPVHGPPSASPPSASPPRFTLQHFRQLDEFMTNACPHNQDARLPADLNVFPPSTIVDMFYGCAAILQWGIAESSTAILSSVGSSYYDNIGSGKGCSEGDDTAEEGGADGGDNGGEASKTPRAIGADKRAARTRARQVNTIEDAMDLVMALWSLSDPGLREEPSPTKEDISRERVNEWLQTQ